MATAAYTTVVDRSVGDALTEAIWDDQLKDNINMLLGKKSGNLLTNGGFEVWQRGTSGFTTTGIYSADRWKQTIGASATLTVTQETGTICTDSRYSLKAAQTGTGPSLIYQEVEAYELRGKTVSLSIRLQQSVASSVTVALGDGTSSATSSSTATTGSFVTHTVSLAVSASATKVTVQINLNLAGTFYLDNAMLVIGPNAAPYEPLHPQEDLARCQRYYEFIGGAVSAIYLNGYQAAGAIAGISLPLKVSKGGNPTVTKVGASWTATNCAQPSVGAVGTYSVQVYTTVTALGQFIFSTSNTTDGITVEWNP